jgi:hypothetical protein
MSKSAFLSIVYVSTSSPALLEPLTHLANSFFKDRGTVFAHSFRDEEYNRTSFFLLDSNGANLVKSTSSLYARALGLLDFRQHKGSHPTLGVCDHITFCPLLSDDNIVSEEEELRRTGEIALSFVDTISPKASVFRYGRATSTGINLADIRRYLGYFDQCKDGGVCVYDAKYLGAKVRECSSTTSNDEVNSLGFYAKSLISLDPVVGVTCVGAIPYLINFNVQFGSNSNLKDVRKVTKRVRELEGVEALTLKPGETYEVACNVTKPRIVGPEEVLRVCFDQAEALSLQIKHSYTTGPLEEELRRILFDAKKCSSKS